MGIVWMGNTYKDNSKSNKTRITNCFKCRTEINLDNQVYYVFIGKTTTENAEYCVSCYLQDIKDAKDLDPFLSDIYSKNFIRMNK